METYTILEDSYKEYLVIAFAYLALAPTLGLVFSLNRVFQHIGIFLLLYINTIDPEVVSTSLKVMDTYRGHSRGFEFSLTDVVALGMIFSVFLTNPGKFKWIPHGYLFWLFYCVLCTFSLINAFALLPAGMAVLKFYKASLVFLAAYHYYQKPSDVIVLARAMAVVILLQFMTVLEQRYVMGMHRVIGGFVHSNPLGMWCYVAAIPMLAIGLSKKTKWFDTTLILVAFSCAGIICVMTITRASLAAFGVGGLAILCLTFVTKPNLKRYAVIATLALGSVLPITLAVDTIMERLEVAEVDTAKGGFRYILNEQSKVMWNDYKVTGLGWNNYGIAASRPYVKYSAVYEDWSRDRYRVNELPAKMFTRNALTESLYWLALAETGVLGFGSFVLFMLVMTWWTFRSIYYQRGTPAAWFCAGFFVVFLLLYPHGLIERILMQNQVLATLLIFIGIVCRIDSGKHVGGTSMIKTVAKAFFYSTRGRPAHVLGEPEDPTPAVAKTTTTPT